MSLRVCLWALGTFGLSAFGACPPMTGWKKIDAQKSFELWVKSEPDASRAQADYRARLVFLRDGKCLALVEGHRASNSVRFPHADAQLELLGDAKGLGAVVRSTYMHGYTEETTSIFYFDESRQSLNIAWSQETYTVSPVGEETERSLVWDASKASFLLKEGSKVLSRWVWDESSLNYLEQN